MQALGALDYIAVVVYMLLMAGIGVFFGRHVKNVGDYLKGSGTIPWAAAGISNYMSLFSTFVFVAYAGVAYEHGLVAVTVLWCTVPASLVAAFYFAKRWRRAGIVTPVEFLETRFNGATRQVFSWGGLAFRLLDNTVRLYAMGVFLSAATPLDLEASILTAGLVILIYTAAGGLWAVVVTDVVQFVILILATILIVPLSLEAAGGLAHMRTTVPAHFTFDNGPRGDVLFLLAYYVMIAFKYNGNWAFIQRFYSVRDERAARNVGLLMAGLFFVFTGVFLLPSIAARVALPELADPEMAYVAMSVHVLPHGVLGLMLAAMFAATMSTLSSEYNVMASVATRDLYVRLWDSEASEQRQMRVARATTLLVALLITTGALYVGGFGGAFEANKLFTGLFAIPMVVPLVFGVALRRPRPWGAIATVVCGIGVGLVLNAHPEIPWAVATLIEIGVCVGVMVGSGFVESRDTAYRARVTAFFARLQTPVAEAEKPVEDVAFRRALARLCMVIITVVGSLFIVMSLPSLGQLSGLLAFAVGLLCLTLGAGLRHLVRRMDRQAESAPDEGGVSETVHA